MTDSCNKVPVYSLLSDVLTSDKLIGLAKTVQPWYGLPDDEDRLLVWSHGLGYTKLDGVLYLGHIFYSDVSSRDEKTNILIYSIVRCRTQYLSIQIILPLYLQASGQYLWHPQQTRSLWESHSSGLG